MTAATLTRPARTATGRRDTVHATACTQPVAGVSWTTRCTACPTGCRMGRHEDAIHPGVQVSRQRVCHGRNSYGPCRDCGCTGFHPNLPQEDHR